MTKVAVLIDGGFFLKRLGTICPGTDRNDPIAVATRLRELVRSHLEQQNKIFALPDPRALLYRVFYYDAAPYTGKTQLPMSGKPLDFGKSKQAVFREGLFAELRKSPTTAVRLGEVRRERGWQLKEPAQKKLLRKAITVDQLTDDDFSYGLRQKAVDMKIGIDIASITLKKQAQTIVLVSGDSDFVPAAKLARREGVRIILDPLWQNVSPDLFEHIDLLTSGVKRPTKD